MNSSANVQHPNKTFVLDIVKETIFAREGELLKRVVIVVADSKETAAMYINEKLNGSIQPNDLGSIQPNDLIWLMGCNHPTIYNQTGTKPLEVQAKIMYNTHAIIKNNN